MAAVNRLRCNDPDRYVPVESAACPRENAAVFHRFSGLGKIRAAAACDRGSVLPAFSPGFGRLPAGAAAPVIGGSAAVGAVAPRPGVLQLGGPVRRWPRRWPGRPHDSHGTGAPRPRHCPRPQRDVRAATGAADQIWPEWLSGPPGLGTARRRSGRVAPVVLAPAVVAVMMLTVARAPSAGPGRIGRIPGADPVSQSPGWLRSRRHARRAGRGGAALSAAPEAVRFSGIRSAALQPRSKTISREK